MSMNDASYATGTGESSWLSQDLTQARYQSQHAHLDLQAMLERGADAQELHAQYQLANNLSQRADELFRLMYEQTSAIASGKETGFVYNPQVRYSKRIY